MSGSSRFHITYDPRVFDDLAGISKSDIAKIKKAIEEKLTSSPNVFGKPVRYSLHGLRRLRVGNYRVVYLIKDGVVEVYLIAHRATVYKILKKRI